MTWLVEILQGHGLVLRASMLRLCPDGLRSIYIIVIIEPFNTCLIICTDKKQPSGVIRVMKISILARNTRSINWVLYLLGSAGLRRGPSDSIIEALVSVR